MESDPCAAAATAFDPDPFGSSSIDPFGSSFPSSSLGGGTDAGTDIPSGRSSTSRNSARMRSISARSSSVGSLRRPFDIRPCIASRSAPSAATASGSSTEKLPSASMAYVMLGPFFFFSLLLRRRSPSSSPSSSTRYESDLSDRPDRAHTSG